MAKGYSIHIGLNYIDINHYGVSGALKSCENDARYMRTIAHGMGYESELVLTQKATRSKLYELITGLSKTALNGDFVLITYSGHGSYIPDLNHDEEDGMDETWCLYDAQLIDDEVFYLLCKFAEGVRVLILTDSCHNKTIYKALGSTTDYLDKCFATEKSVEIFQSNKKFYENISLLMNEFPKMETGASIITIAACSDTETTGAGLDQFSLSAFTKSLKDIWETDFTGNYDDFVKSISKKEYGREAQISYLGKNTEIFKNQTPFTI